MTNTARPVFQHQGPATNCVIGGRKLGWSSCTAYAMAMGIDSATGGAHRPTGCKIRDLTDDTDDHGTNLRQVAEVAEAHYGVRVSLRTGPNATTPGFAARAANAGRGFVLQGNTGGLPPNLHLGGSGAANHAVWVNEVRGGTVDKPERALVFDPAADGIHRRWQWWPWDVVRAFAAALVLDEHTGRTLGAGRMYAGFTQRRQSDAAAAPPPVPATADGTVLRFNATKTTPFPDRVRADPPKGRRVNVRSRPDPSSPASIVDMLPAGSLFVAFQRTTAGAKPNGSNSRVWYGSRDGTEWIHESGLSHIGGPKVMEREVIPLSAEPPADTDIDLDADDIVEGAEDLPDDIRNDVLATDGPPDDGVSVADTNLDAPVVGSPPRDDEIDQIGGV